jgi:lantibiotic biosynthesis protein
MPEWMADFFVLRTPLLPVEDFLAWSEGLDAPVSPDEPGAIGRRRERLRLRLVETMARPEVSEAVFVASAEVAEAVAAWLENPADRRARGIERALVRYLTRMTLRPTPFGLFAGWSVGTIAAKTQLVLERREAYRRHSRLDLGYLDELTRTLARDSDVDYRPNTSLYPAGGRLHYVETRQDGGRRTHHLVALTRTPDLDQTLRRAAEGASAKLLASALDGASPDEARSYVRELIQSQVLVSDLEPALTGPEPIEPLIERLREHGGPADLLARVGAELAAIDGDGVGVDPERYRVVGRSLDELPVSPGHSVPVQVDLIKPAARATLGRPVVREFARAAELLQRLSRQPQQTELSRFREAFESRYGEQLVPLVEALDDEVGVGFAQPAGTQLLWTAREELLLRKVTEAAGAGAAEIELGAGELDRLSEGERGVLPDAFAVLGRLAARSEEALNRGEFRVFLQAIDGPSAAPLLARFCHAERELLARLRRHVRADEESAPDAIHAEIVHLPESGHFGNVVLRPLFREYEIPYLGRSGAPSERQLPVTDLLVSVSGGEIVLHSARLQRSIVPRLSCAHDYFSSTVPVYRFLCLLQLQGASYASRWNWGPLDGAHFLPRVRVGRAVLALACWNLDHDEISRLCAASFGDLRRWRENRSLPRFVLLAGGEDLAVDFDNLLSVESFIQLLRGRQSARLVELFPAIDELCVRGPEGGFAHEVVLPFVRSAAPPRARASAPTRTSAGLIRRSFTAGSEWLYAKLYTGASTADGLLLDVIRSLAEDTISSGTASSWFFIRYADPDWHLRLRFRGQPASLVRDVVPRLHAAVEPLLEDGRVWRLQFDTYEREVERYGGPAGIEAAEKIFELDSEAVLKLLASLPPGDAGAERRIQLALAGIFALCSDFGLDDTAAHSLVRRQRDLWNGNRPLPPHLRQRQSERFREQRKTIESLLEQAPHEALRERSRRIAPLVASLRDRERAERLAMPIVELVPSFVHMYVNRLLRSDHVRAEVELYDTLTRVYRSRAVRNLGPPTGASRVAKRHAGKPMSDERRAVVHGQSDERLELQKETLRDLYDLDLGADEARATEP